VKPELLFAKREARLKSPPATAQHSRNLAAKFQLACKFLGGLEPAIYLRPSAAQASQRPLCSSLLRAGSRAVSELPQRESCSISYGFEEAAAGQGTGRAGREQLERGSERGGIRLDGL